MLTNLEQGYKSVPLGGQKKFWKVGRVFRVLWTEPARDGAEENIIPLEGTQRSVASHYVSVWLGGKAFTEIRHFVVVQEGHGNSIC